MTDDIAILGKRIALLIWNTEQEDDVRVFAGEIIKEDPVYYFINQPEQWKLRLTAELLGRLKAVPEDQKDILLDADFVISVSMGSMPGEGNEGYDNTGIKWARF